MQKEFQELLDEMMGSLADTAMAGQLAHAHAGLLPFSGLLVSQEWVLQLLFFLLSYSLNL